MLNLFSKTKSWMVASLLATTVAIAAQDNTKGRPQKSYEQGHEVAKNQLMPAYNAPAAIDVRSSWDVYITGSFLYWQAREDNLELGVVSNGLPLDAGGPFIPINLGPTITATTTSGYVANADFSYGPGFKVGIGANCDYDGWDAYAEYTWFHKTSNSMLDLTAPVMGSDDDATCVCSPSTDFIFPTRILPAGLTLALDSEKAFKTVMQSWRVKMDFLDLSLARSYYLGTKLSVRPFFGARGAWIRQVLKTEYTNQAVTVPEAINPPIATINGFTVNPAYYNTQSGRIRSWGVGPRVGFESNWMLGYGFRLIGDASADVLYTRYDLRNKGLIHTRFLTSLTSTAVGTGIGRLVQNHIDMLRPHVDLEMGFGWGSYFDNSNWHVDFLATYGYQVFWDQNMFRNFTQSETARSFLPNGNLYVHGMTFTARFDF